MAQQMLCLVLLVVAVIAIIVVSVLLVQCHNSKGNTYTEPTHFCGTCQGLGQKVCTDRPALDRLYRDGTLNETSHLFRGNQWSVTMPADQFHRKTELTPSESYKEKYVSPNLKKDNNCLNICDKVTSMQHTCGDNNCESWHKTSDESKMHCKGVCSASNVQCNILSPEGPGLLSCAFLNDNNQYTGSQTFY